MGHTSAGLSDQLEEAWQDFPQILLYSALEEPSSRAELQHPARQCWLSQAISGHF